MSLSQPRQVDLLFGLKPGNLFARSAHIVVVDPLFFGTSIDLATAAGAFIYPVVATEGSESMADRLSAGFPQKGLETESLRPLAYCGLGLGDRLLLPPTAGGAIVHAILASLASELPGDLRAPPLRADRKTVIALSLRNAAAVGAWLNERVGDILLIAGSDPAAMGAKIDVFAAGALVAALSDVTASSTAESARLAFVAAINGEFRSELREDSMRVHPGLSWTDEDWSLVFDLDASPAVPLLDEGGGFASF